MNTIKVAIIHEWFMDSGGSEQVVEEIISIFPNADIFTLFSAPSTIKKYAIDKNRVTSSYLNNLPFVNKYYRFLFPFYPSAIEGFDLSAYDLIISSSHCAAKGVLTFHNQVHICYCHSPVRYIWDLHFEYLNSMKSKFNLFKYFLRLKMSEFRLWDQISSSRVDHFIANSSYVASRIKKNYGRDSEVIYPFIDINRFKISNARSEYYVTCSRFVSYKRVDLIVSAFVKLNKKLIVIGDGPDKSLLVKLGNDNIQFVGSVSHDDLVSYLSMAKAFVYAANEDFGIAPVEAQACGTPVICFAKGGLAETVINDVTGVFYYTQTVDALVDAVHYFEDKYLNLANSDIIRHNALRFDKKVFVDKFVQFVSDKVGLANIEPNI